MCRGPVGFFRFDPVMIGPACESISSYAAERRRRPPAIGVMSMPSTVPSSRVGCGLGVTPGGFTFVHSPSVASSVKLRRHHRLFAYRLADGGMFGERVASVPARESKRQPNTALRGWGLNRSTAVQTTSRTPVGGRRSHRKRPYAAFHCGRTRCGVAVNVRCTYKAAPRRFRMSACPTGWVHPGSG